MKKKHPLEHLNDDIRDFLERETADNLERGMSPEAARDAARRAFGNVTRAQEEAHEVWRWVWLDQFWQDVRYAVRTLRGNPGLTSVVILTLTLGIGLNTAVFSIVNAVLLRPLSYPNSERLLWISAYEKLFNEEFVSGEQVAAWRAQAASLESLAGYLTSDVTVVTSEGAVRTGLASVSHDFWKLSGARPVLGRLPEPNETGALLVSHGFFERSLHADPGAAGKAVRIGNQQFTIAGVLPEGFRFEAPPGSFPAVTLEIGVYGAMIETDPRFGLLTGAFARLKPGQTIEGARAEFEVIRARTAVADAGQFDELELRVLPLQERLVGQNRQTLWLLLAAVMFVLAIASANIANLLLARASARQKEIAIRASVGAGRARVLRQFLVESAVFALAGGACGLVLARAGIAVLLRAAPGAIPRLAETTIDAQVLAFALGASLLTALSFGIAPAVALWKVDVHDALKDGSRAASATAGHLRLRKLLVAVELALAVVLLTGAGLMIKSFWRMHSYPPGFDPERILTLQIPLEGPRYFGVVRRQIAFVEELLGRLRSMPGVEAVTPMDRGHGNGNLWENRPDPPGDEGPITAGTVVAAEYARMVGLRLLKGRWLNDNEPDGAIVINESLARRDFPRQDPLGARMKYWGPVVGVVADLKTSRLDAPAEPEFYAHYRFSPRLDGTTLGLLASGDPLSLVPTVLSAAAEIDSTLPVYNVQTVEHALADSIAPRRFHLFLLAAFAVAAVALALIGIYGVIAYAVAQRTHEIGVRMALGARGGEVTRMVIAQGMRIASIGIAAGLAGAFALTRVMASLLYDVKPNDAPTFAAVGAALLVTALAASGVPALRAARVDPLVALRHE